MTVKSGGGRPTGYYNTDGDKLPSVTGITGRGKDSGGLIFVAKRNWHEAGRKGLPFERDAYWSDKDALQIGSVVHTLIEADIHGKEDATAELALLPTAFLTDVMAAFDAYLKWRKAMNIEVIATEVPLVSEEYGFGGTIDAIAYVAGEPVILDWKTSNSVYPDYVAQLAAYRELVNTSAYPEFLAVDEAYLLRVGKELGDFHFHSYNSRVLDLGWQWFLHAKGLYELDKRLAKVAA